MNMDIKNWKDVENLFEQLSMREKVLMLASGLVAVLFGGFVYMVEPVQIQIKKLTSDVERQKSQLGMLDNQIMALELELAQDPNEPLRKNLARYQAELVEIDARLKEQTVDLIPANKMPEVLEKILSQSKKLKVIKVDSIPPVRMMDINSEGGAKVNLFQHGVLLVLEGEYGHIWEYLDEIEQLEWRFYWKRFDYLVQEHPRARAEIELYTLSTSKAFIGV